MPDHRLGRQNGRREYYDRFPAAEMDRRHAAVRERMREAGLDALVVCGDSGFADTHVGYLTNYHPPFVCYFVFFADPDADSLLLAGLSNHKQYVREVSEADDVGIMLPDPMGKVADRLAAGGAAAGTVGLVGHHPRYEQGLSHAHHEALDSAVEADLVDATPAVIDVVRRKSDVELDRVRRAAELTDLGLEVMAEAATPGATEADVRDALVRAYLDTDGGLGMAFVNSAPMEGAEPGAALPWHKPSRRELREGDVVTTEMGAAHRGYRSQVHRTFTVGADPTPEYEDLWGVARETYDRMLAAVRAGNTVADVHAALAPIEESPYRLYDVALHGYGNGYLPPYVGTTESNYWPAEADPVTAGWTFVEGEVVVLQPNVVSAEERHGLQLGSAVVVRDGPPEVLQEFPLPIARV